MTPLRLSILLWFSFIFSNAAAQVQSGYVKTLGRPNQKGKPLSGVIIRAKGSHNTVLSGSDGSFMMTFADKKEGDGYILQQVHKAGFELNDVSMVGRIYAFSSTIPLTIVMTSSMQFQLDKQRIESHAYAEAEKNYKEKIEKLEQQKTNNEITAEQFQLRILDLQKQFENYQSMIDGLAERYAHTDYDNLDVREREINICIENGNLERADSLIANEDIRKRIYGIEKKIENAKYIKKEASKLLDIVLKQQDKDAFFLFQLYTIALGKFEKEKARFYIETRAALDSTNVRWQIDAGEFIDTYYNDFGKALSYYSKAFRHTDIESIERAECYNDIGLIYATEGKLNLAEEYLQHSLNLRKTILGDSHSLIGTAYNNLGACYFMQGRYDDAIEYHIKSLECRKLY